MSSCSMLSLDAQEPMIASTLEHIHHWILVEQPKAWPARPSVDDLDVSEAQRTMIVQALEKEGTRLQWIRNIPSGSKRIFLCTENRLYVANEQTQELTPDQMTPYDLSLVLVCTHGSRDRCCGTLGGAIYAKAHKQAPKQVWQASHLGGHRFAPTLLVLPQGMMYGRIEEDDIPALLSHPSHTPFSCERLRGVPQWPKEVQTAAHSLWKNNPVAVQSFSSTSTSSHTWDVSLTTDQNTTSYHVSKESLGVSIPASCGDTKRKELYRYTCTPV